MCHGDPDLDGSWVFAGEWYGYGICVLLMYFLLADLPRNTSLTVLWINTAIGLEGGVDERMLMGSALGIVWGGG